MASNTSTSASAKGDAFSHALQCNKTWSGQFCAENGALMETLSKTQKPEILWIGCSDSRCPETTLLGLKPGDVFVHRNIANILHAADLSSSAVIAYAVGHLKVNHVVLCGHTGCGGVAAALGDTSLGLLDAWLLPLKQLKAQHAHQLKGMEANAAALMMVEANVKAGVKTLRENGVVVQAIKERGLVVHGCVYNVGTGQLQELDVKETEEHKLAREAAFGVK